MDVIEVRGIRANGKHGANPGEREREQPFVIDVRVEMDLQAAAQTDDLAATLNYTELHAGVVTIVESTSFALLERLALEVLQAVFTDSRVARAQVRIAKPELFAGATPSVTLVRDNPRFRARFP